MFNIKLNKKDDNEKRLDSPTFASRKKAEKTSTFSNFSKPP
jgi:hypothetical protein